MVTQTQTFSSKRIVVFFVESPIINAYIRGSRRLSVRLLDGIRH